MEVDKELFNNIMELRKEGLTEAAIAEQLGISVLKLRTEVGKYRFKMAGKEQEWEDEQKRKKANRERMIEYLKAKKAKAQDLQSV